MLANLQQSFVSAVTIAELSRVKDRLDPGHAQTATVVATMAGALARIDPAKVVIPTSDQRRGAGEQAGAAVRAIAGELRSFRAAADRHELLHDALTAAVASAAAVTVVTEAAISTC